MNVLKALIAVISMQHATTLKGVTPALAILDTQAMVFHALVSAVTLQSQWSTTAPFVISVIVKSSNSNSDD